MGLADEHALTEDGCRFHGWVHPLSQHCEDGCTWWTYRFEDGSLTSAELERSEWDVNAEWAARFTAEAHQVAAELSRRLHAEPTVEVIDDWIEVEMDEDGDPRVIERRTWTLPDRRVVWSVSGNPGHHPGHHPPSRSARRAGRDARPASLIPVRRGDQLGHTQLARLVAVDSHLHCTTYAG